MLKSQDTNNIMEDMDIAIVMHPSFCKSQNMIRGIPPTPTNQQIMWFIFPTFMILQSCLTPETFQVPMTNMERIHGWWIDFSVVHKF